MDNQRVAIIGLGRIGSAFLSQLTEKARSGIELVCVAESADTPGRRVAQKAGVRICTLDEIVALGPKLDVVFELTGLPEVRRELREKFLRTDNHQTVIASESIARVIWAMISDGAPPLIPGRPTGY